MRRVMDVTRLDSIRNVDVRNELEIEPLIDNFEQGELSGLDT